MSIETYKVVRKFFDDDMADEVVEVGLTLEEAKAHCSNKETNSRTCTNKEGQLLTLQMGEWFDSFEEE